MPRQKEGSIHRRDGRLYARVSYVDASGKQRFIERRADNKIHARELIRKLLNDLANGGSEIFEGERLLFREAAERYSKWKLVPAQYVDDRKVAGIRSLPSAQRFLRVITDYFGNRRIRSITHADLDQFKRNRLNTPTIQGRQRSIASVNRELEMLRAVFHFAHREGWIITNPFHRGKSLISKADERKRQRILTAEEEARLLAACTGRRAHLRPILITALDTAMRCGELLRLEWADVDFARRVINVRATTTKTLEPRIIGMTSRVIAGLQELWESSPKDAQDRVFGIESNVRRSFTGACQEAGISGFRFHDLRHTAITRWIESGTPEKLAMKGSGHTQPTTFSRYVNVDMQIAQQIAARLDQTIISERMTRPEMIH
jgi:integrase